MNKKKHFVVEKAIELSKELQASSEQGILLAQDDGCAALCGIFRDCAHKLKLQAQLEQERHSRVTCSKAVLCR